MNREVNPCKVNQKFRGALCPKIFQAQGYARGTD
jgi:hypothetical protein